MCKCVSNIKIIVQTWIPNRRLVPNWDNWSLTWNSSLRKSSIEYALDYRLRNWLSSILHTTHTTAIVDFQFCFLIFKFSHWLPGVGFTFFFQPQLLTSNFVSYSSSFLFSLASRCGFHFFLSATIVDLQFCFLFFQFSHWHPGVGFTFFFLLLGLRGMRDKSTIVKRFGTKAINFILQRTRVSSKLFFQLHFRKL